MTPAGIEAAIRELTAGLAIANESIKNLRERVVENKREQQGACEKLDASLGGQSSKLADLDKRLALIEKEMLDLKRSAEENRKNRWALGIAILSAILSLISGLTTAVVLSRVKK